MPAKTKSPATIMPAFQRFPDEAAIIGRLLAGYGELEYELTMCLAHTMDDINTAPRALFRVRGEKQRILTADALMRQKYIAAKLEEHYCEAIGAMHHCRTIRNQYAHCHWWDDQGRGLFFLNFEAAAQKHGPIEIMLRNVDVPLLQTQESYFRYVQGYLWFLRFEYTNRTGKFSSRGQAAPKKLPRPKLYNPPETHPPPPIGSNNQNPAL